MRVGIDTNALIRMVVDDDSAQVAAVARLVRAHHIVIAPTALLESEWALRRVLGLDRSQIIAGFDRLLGLTTATFLHRHIVNAAMRAFRSGCDFADACHAAAAGSADLFVTFDRDFAQRAKALDYLPAVRLLPRHGYLTTLSDTPT